MTCRSRRLKAQIALEYMFIFALLLASLILGVWFAYTKTQEVNQETLRLHAENLLIMAGSKVDTAWLEGSGFSTNVTMPETVSGYDYTLNITSNILVLEIPIYERGYSITMVTDNITGQFTLGEVNTIANIGDHINISS